MYVIHAGGNRAGERILEILQKQDDVVASATTLEHLVEECRAQAPDWIVGCGFRHLIPVDVLALAGNTCNVHPSLLPHGRGSHPNVWMIAGGEPAGVSIHQMTGSVDAGPVFAQRPVAMTFVDTAFTLYQRLEDASVELFAEMWPSIRRGAVAARPQPDGGRTHTSRDFAALCNIDLDATVTWGEALNTLRALTFPPHENVIVRTDGGDFNVTVLVEPIRRSDVGSSPDIDKAGST